MQKIRALILVIAVITACMWLSACGSFHAEGAASVAWGDGLKVERSSTSNVGTTQEREVISEGSYVASPEPLLLEE